MTGWWHNPERESLHHYSLDGIVAVCHREFNSEWVTGDNPRRRCKTCDRHTAHIVLDLDEVLWVISQAANAEIERLRALITAWADAWDAADRGEERDDGVGVYKYAERQEVALRKAVGR